MVIIYRFTLWCCLCSKRDGYCESKMMPIDKSCNAMRRDFFCGAGLGFILALSGVDSDQFRSSSVEVTFFGFDDFFVDRDFRTKIDPQIRIVAWYCRSLGSSL